MRVKVHNFLFIFGYARLVKRKIFFYSFSIQLKNFFYYFKTCPKNAFHLIEFKGNILNFSEHFFMNFCARIVHREKINRHTVGCCM